MELSFFLTSMVYLHPVGVPAIDDDFRLVESSGLFVWRPILERLLAPYPTVGIIVSSTGVGSLMTPRLSGYLARWRLALSEWLNATGRPGLRRCSSRRGEAKAAKGMGSAGMTTRVSSQRRPKTHVSSHVSLPRG
jgi:hypothetical protein